MIKILIAVLVFSAAGLMAADSGKGKAIYASKCASCHGKDAKGNPAMARMFKLEPAALNLIDEDTLSKSDEELSSITLKGKGKMTAFQGKLKETEVADLLAYLRGLGPKKEEKAEAKEKKEEPKGEESKASAGPDLEAMAKLYAAKCASCHGKNGKGNPAMAKMFKVEPSVLDMADEDTLKKTDEDLIAVTSKGAGKMPGYSDKLKADEISGIIAYLRSLGPKKEEKKEETEKKKEEPNQ